MAKYNTLAIPSSSRGALLAVVVSHVRYFSAVVIHLGGRNMWIDGEKVEKIVLRMEL